MSFADKIKSGNEKILRSINNKAQRAIKETARRIIDRTPVKTGKLKGNWVAGVNIMPAFSIAAPNPKGKSTKIQINKIVATLPTDKDWTFYLVNNVHYGYNIEYDGTSQKAPQGMVRITFAEIQKIFKDA